MIEARHLGKNGSRDRKHGTVCAVNDVSFPAGRRNLRAPRSQRRGKTTMLRILATILAPSEGTAIVAGYDVTKDPQIVRSRVGFFSTATALYARFPRKRWLNISAGLHGLERIHLCGGESMKFSRVSR